MMSDDTLKALQDNKQVAATYVQPNGESANGVFPHNPNGAIADIAAITDETGKVLAMMPHPERGMFTWQRDDYMELKDKAQREGAKLPEEADGISLFQNAAKYFEGAQKKK